MNTKYLLDQKNMWDKSAQNTTDRFLQIHFTDNFNPYESIFNELNYYLDFDDKKILEVGCGNGLILERIVNQTKNVDIYGIDISTNLIEETKRAIPSFKNNLHVADASKLPFENEFFDTVYSNSIFQYFPDLEYAEQVIEEMVRITKPGGKLFIGDIYNSRLKIIFEKYFVKLEIRSFLVTKIKKMLNKYFRRNYIIRKYLYVEPNYFLERFGSIGKIYPLLISSYKPELFRQFRYNVLIEKNR